MVKCLFPEIEILTLLQFMKYVILGGALYLFSVFFMWVTIEYLHISPLLSLCLLQIIIFFLSFVLSKKVIFKKASDQKKQLDQTINNKKNETIEQGKLYFILFVFFRFLDWFINIIFIEYVGIPYYISLISTIFIILPFKFFLYKKKVFK